MDYIGALLSVITIRVMVLNPILLIVFGIGNGLDLTFRILGAKAENRAWREFHQQTENEERKMKLEFENLLASVEKIGEQWKPLR